jgi:hypothetical protein
VTITSLDEIVGAVPGTALRIPRSLNAQWTKGGILYAPSIR